VVALGMEPAFPRLARAAGKLTRLHSRQRRSSTVFCTEFLAHVLQKLGHLPPEFAEHWFLAPIHFTQSVARIDELCGHSRAPRPLFWGAERALVCGPSVLV
jgi:hypothetical protein